MASCRTYFFDGQGVSAGVVIGTAFVIEHHGFNVESTPIQPEEVDGEIERFRDAVEQAKLEIQDLGRAVTEKIDAQQAAIFDAHVILLCDPLLIDKTIDSIRQDRLRAEFVFWTVAKEISAQLKGLNDPYFSERSHDLFDIARRVLKFLQRIKNPEGESIPEGSIIVASDLGPSETAHLHRDRIAGFVTDAGGTTSHTAIMAKALGLPAVVGLDYITHYVRTGDFLIVDGGQGKVILNPSAEQIGFYEKRADEFQRVREGYSETATLPAVTLDGAEIRLEGNIEFLAEIPLVLSQGAAGIGLFRTEYFFIDRVTLPTEDEQEQAYTRVIQEMGDREVVFRTLDVGGDKLSSNIPTPHESNPFLGLRALRLCLAYPELFRCQLRPMLKSAKGHTLSILLPMISGVEEVREAKRHIRQVNDELEAEGHLVPEEIRIGAMIEIPSAAIQAEVIGREIDFFSIGTNDLVQYTLAVDRVNKLVSSLYNETHPAVLQLIKRVVDAGQKLDKPVTVCGEMASDPQMALLLIGLGIRTLSMTASQIGPVKRAVRGIELSYLEQMAAELLEMSSASEVRAGLMERLHSYQSPQSA